MRALLLLLTLVSWRVAGGDYACCQACYLYQPQSLCNSAGCMQDSCPIGTYLNTACTGLDAIGRYRCQPCADGTYRSSLNMDQAFCADCRGGCADYEIQTSDCTSISNLVCQVCGPGLIKVQYEYTDACVECPAGTYTSNRITCSTCTSCTILQKQTAGCQSYQDRQCASCPTGTKVANVNDQDCTLCIDGYFQISGTSQFQCQSCASTTCASGYWQNCVGGTRSCEVCAGHVVINPSSSCEIGKGVPGVCTGTSRTNTLCTTCAAGTERTATTPLVSGVQVCAKCDTGKYKTASMAACGSCTNAPLNSVYKAYGPTEQATTATCPYICRAGYYLVTSTCSLCPTGKYKDIDGNSACSACTTVKAKGYYLARLSGVISSSDSCPWYAMFYSRDLPC
jgi:hypothetical protein